MNRILEVDTDSRIAWVEPGVVNLDLTKHLTPLGYHFAPDPSSQQVCTIGGNVGNNSGGPHCLAYGVTNAHILAIEVVLADGEIIMLEVSMLNPPGMTYEACLSAERGCAITTKVAVRITRTRHRYAHFFSRSTLHVMPPQRQALSSPPESCLPQWK